ncbi:DUF7533 family protein [Halorhabdus amylolytica]|uniref:DUF7533 family protein n=1 Tax=Halorhabdus amylolytica TaxID=2559573 RepID=UPI0010A9A3EC|nr:hypothetical protein [Halorhabdus amylolytica]
MASGILEMIGQAGTVVIVAPIVVIALDFLASGRLLGGLAFLGIVGLIFAIERYIVTFGDLLERGLGGLVERIVKTDSTDDD